MVDLTTSDVARLVFCAGVADMVRFTWGDLTIMLARSCKDLPVAAMALVTIRAVSIPSPVACFGKMMWPDCSPPIGISFFCIASATLESPTAVISA